MTTALFLPYDDGNPYQSELARGLRAEGVDVVTGDHTDPLPVLQSFLEHGCPDVLHLHWAHSLVVSRYKPVTFVLCVRLLFELTIARLLGVDVVWTVHNRFHHERRHSPLELERACRHAICRFANAIIVHSEAARDVVVTTYGLPDHVADRIAVVPHGNYVESYADEVTQAEARDHLDLPADATVFVHLGNIRPYKNVDELVDTFAEMPESHLRLLVAGRPPKDGAARSHLEKTCASDDRMDCVFGFVPSDEIQLYMRAADAVVLPFSDVLTSGSVVLAMSFGRPVVAPRVGSIPETVGDCDDLLYDPTAENGLEGALRLAMDADLTDLQAAASARAAELDWETIGQRTAAIYDQRIEPSVEAVDSKIPVSERK